MFPEFRALFRGFARLFIKDMATTPEGAEAIYGEKIDQAQDAYTKADNAYKVASGKLATAKRDLDNLRSRLTKLRQSVNPLLEMARLNWLS